MPAAASEIGIFCITPRRTIPENHPAAGTTKPAIAPSCGRFVCFAAAYSIEALFTRFRS
jgi:hypothetical protein